MVECSSPEIEPLSTDKYAVDDPWCRPSSSSAGTEDADTRETIATMLWHRFAPNHHIEWKYETLRAEYLEAADQVIAALRSPDAAQPSGRPPVDNPLKAYSVEQLQFEIANRAAMTSTDRNSP